MLPVHFLPTEVITAVLAGLIAKVRPCQRYNSSIETKFLIGFDKQQIIFVKLGSTLIRLNVLNG
jgi:hypothetical protein